jgi:hypothetical protein
MWIRSKLSTTVPVLYQNQFQLLPRKLPALEVPCWYILIFNLMLEDYTLNCQVRMLVTCLLVAQEVPLASTMGLGLMDLMSGGMGQCLL